MVIRRLKELSEADKEVVFKVLKASFKALANSHLQKESMREVLEG